MDPTFGDQYQIDGRVPAGMSMMWATGNIVSPTGIGGSGGSVGGGNREGAISSDLRADLPLGEHGVQSGMDRQINTMLSMRANANKTRSVVPMHSFGETSIL